MIAEVDLHGLVDKAQAFDRDAWDALYRRVYGSLYRYARRRLPSDAAADDAVSETMIRALDRIGRFTWQGAGFEGWLFGILRNVVHEHHRSATRGAPVNHMPVPVMELTPVDHVLAAEEVRAVRAAFFRLNAEDQELLELRVVAGLSSEQVASVQGRRPGAVRMAQSRALARLRSLLSTEIGDG